MHGAMCMSYSGRCFLSAYLTGRDANQGDCAQPCRWQYALMEQTRPGQYFPVEQDKRGTYFLSSYDLCMIEHLDDLQKAGVSSLKIEGRMKSPLLCCHRRPCLPASAGRGCPAFRIAARAGLRQPPRLFHRLLLWADGYQPNGRRISAVLPVLRRSAGPHGGPPAHRAAQ